MEKILKWCSVSLAGILLTIGVVGTLAVPVLATDENKIQPRDAGLELTSEEKLEAIPPTFTTEVDESDELARFWMGKNLFIAGNNINTDSKVPTGLMFVAGNTLKLDTEAEYSFIAGNTVDFSGETSRDLFIAANLVTLEREAKIGRDVYVAANSINIKSDLEGDLSVTAAVVELQDVEIEGNVNLSADTIKFIGNVKIAGALTYNENANISGLEHTSYGSIEAYEVAEISPTTRFVAAVYGKIVSIAALFLIIAIICAIYPKLHERVAAEADVNHFGIDLALGFGALLIIPLVALFSFISFVAAPLGIVALAAYGIMVYLAQGFAGVWLGHLIMEKLFKSKGNIFAEAFIGILILGLLALIPYIGVITGFLGLLLGLGLILQCIKPAKANSKVITKPTISSKKAK